MPLVTMRQLLDEAAKGGYGVGAFNVNNMEQIQAIMEAARATRSPVIIQASRGARSYTNDRFLWHLMLAASELYEEIPVALHLDHGNAPDTCLSAIELGFTSVMMDGSLEADGKTPSSFEYNVAVTREVVDVRPRARCHRRGRARHAGRNRGRPRLRRGAPHRSRPGRRVRPADRHRRPGGRDRHQPRRLQVHAPPRRRGAGHEPDRGDPRQAADHAPGDARLVARCRATSSRRSTATAAR